MSKQRREDILSRLHKLGYVSARQLAKDYQVNPSTIRRDLDTMAQLGMIERSHGGATLPAEPAETPYDVKIEKNVTQKRAIARAVAGLVPHGRSLLMDSGSTTLEVARALRGHREMTVITNDLRVAAEIANQGDVRLIVLGGEALPSVYTLASERAVRLISEFHVDYAVMGADAVTVRGITNTNSNEVSMKRAMLRAAEQVLVVADSSKFGESALVRVAGLEDVDLIVTDDGLSEGSAAEYRVEIRRVSVDSPAGPPPTLPMPDEGRRMAMEPALVPAGAAPRGSDMRFVGIDIGTGSTKGVVVDASGTVLATATRPSMTSSPRTGWFEHDADGVWWTNARSILCELLAGTLGPVAGVAVSGIGPVVQVTDADDVPLRPAILYGIDTRADEQVTAQNEHFGPDTLLATAGNLLSSQAVGPKLAWVAENEPGLFARARRLYSAQGWVVRRLTGSYVLDHYSASAYDPLYELRAHAWWEPGWSGFDRIERPELAWPGDVVGRVSEAASRETGLPPGTPVIAGTIDALAEAYSVGSSAVGDTMLMYGSTMFMLQTVAAPAVHPGLWAAVGRTAETFSSAAGMSTSGLITNWLSDLSATSFGDLLDEARRVPAGSEGLLLLPYFAGERTPIFDPHARAAWVGMSLRHGRGHLYRSILEAVAFGVRHNLSTMAAAGARPGRLVAVGGGIRDALWAQIVSDVTGLSQDIPTVTVGASYGDARMAADAAGVDTSGWNPVARRTTPDLTVRDLYDSLYAAYISLYPALSGTMHLLAGLNR